MSDDQRSELARKPIVLRVPGMDTVAVRKDQPYGESGGSPISYDLYSPPGLAPGELRPLVLFVFGFPDPLFADGLKNMECYATWARLFAASGIHAVTYTYRDPVADLVALRRHLQDHAGPLGLDTGRVAVWACSGNVPVALSLLITAPTDAFRCAVLCYGLMLDVDGASGIAAGAAQFGFAYPLVGCTLADLPPSLPLFVARAGRDATPQLNAALDRFVTSAIAHNLPLTLVNHATAPHAFDMLDDSEATREVIRSIVAFTRSHLR
jgi:acetyl esterase/lipase